MTNPSVKDLIQRAGGADDISLASQGTEFPVSPSAVHKWRKNGIPDEHWPIFISAGARVEELFRANELLRRAKSGREVDVPTSRRRSSTRVAA
jgi:hypothetical protein